MTKKCRNGTATQEKLTSYDASSLVTPETFDMWCKEQEPPLEDGMDDKVDAACTKMLQDTENQQKNKEKINITSNVVLREAHKPKNNDNSASEQLLSTPRSKVTSNKGQFYKTRKDNKKRKFEFKKPIVPVPAPQWLQKEWAKESTVAKPPKPLTPEVTIIEGPQLLSTENGKQFISEVPTKDNEQPPKKRRLERKITDISQEKPSWVDVFSNAKETKLPQHFKFGIT